MKRAVPTVGPKGELLLAFDDQTAYGYLSGENSECSVNLKELIEKRIGKSIEISYKLLDNGVSAKETIPSLLDNINFKVDIEDDE